MTDVRTRTLVRGAEVAADDAREWGRAAWVLLREGRADEAAHAAAWARARGEPVIEVEDALAIAELAELGVRSCTLAVDLGPRPVLAWRRDARGLVAADTSGAIVEVEVASGRGRRIAMVDGEVCALGLEPSGTRAAVIVARGGTTYLVDLELASGRAGLERDLWCARVDGIAALPMETIVAERRGRVRTFGLGNAVTTRAARHALVAQDGTIALAGSREVTLEGAVVPRGVLALDPASSVLLRETPLVVPNERGLRRALSRASRIVERLASAVALDPVGRFAAFASDARQGLAIVDLDSGAARAFTEVRGRAAAFSPSGRTLAVASGRRLSLISAR